MPLPDPKITIEPAVAVAEPSTPECTITLSSIEIEVPESTGLAPSKWNVLPEPTIETGPLVLKLATSSVPPDRGARSTTAPSNTASGEWIRC